MSCRRLEELFVSGADAFETRVHCASCRDCEALTRELDEASRLVSKLAPPELSVALRQTLLAIPRQTVSCGEADGLIARAMDDELPAAERKRLDFHLSRCGACTEATGALSGVSELTRPEPAPWLSQRVAALSLRAAPRARRRAEKLSGWRWLLDPKAAIGFAYAAAVVVMLAGFNPADLAERARTGGIPEKAKTAVAAAGRSAADRLGWIGEKAVRTLVVWRGHASGYGRAVFSNALARVMKSEPKRPPIRPRVGEEKGVLQSNETELNHG